MTKEAGKEDLVPGARCDHAHLSDLTTEGTQRTGHTNPIDWGGGIPLHAKGTTNPTGVPGLQIDGYFLDDASETTRVPGNPYGNKKYPYDSQFVIRFPTAWNGKLVVTGAPGIRGQYANDFMIGDFVLKKGYAFASTDKGNSGLRFYCADRTPGAAVAEWHRRVKQLTEAAKAAAEKYYGERPARTYITGTSNAGYLTRYALEKTPELYDGGVDWQGVLWRPEGPNLLTSLPKALKHFPVYVMTKDKPEHEDLCRAAHEAMIQAGFEEGSEFLWQYHYNIYWGSVQRIFRDEFDPYYPGAEAEYDYLDRNYFRSQEVKNAVARVSLTGSIGKPLITLHGTLDTLLPIKETSDVYARLVRDAGKSHLHRYYTIEKGTHVDSLYDSSPDKLRPILPCYRAAFDRLVDWVEEGSKPPWNQSVPKPDDGDVVNSCPPLEKRGA